MTGLHGDVHQSVHVSVSWAKPYRVCQCECSSVCVLVRVSLIVEAGARPAWMEAKTVFWIKHAGTHMLFVCLFRWRETVRSWVQSWSMRCADRWTLNKPRPLLLPELSHSQVVKYWHFVVPIANWCTMYPLASVLDPQSQWKPVHGNIRRSEEGDRGQSGEVC